MEKVYAQEYEKIFEFAESSTNGLSYQEAKKRLEANGKNSFIEIMYMRKLGTYNLACIHFLI